MSFRGLHANRVRRGSILLVLALTVVAGACGSSGSSKAISTTKTTVSESSTTAPGGSSGTSVAPPNGASGSTTSVAPTTSTAPASAPDTPTGLFLNSHTLSLSGGDVPSAGQSVCKTSPGASCEIRFTNANGTHTLDAKVTGADGIAEWSWTPAAVGLTAGHWNVEIVATRGAAAASANDPRGLQIDP